MLYEIKAIKGIETDTKVQEAAAKLSKYEPANRKVVLEIKHDKENRTSTCKILGLGKKPTIGTGENPAKAVSDAVKKFTSAVSNDQKTAVDKKEHARKKSSKQEVVEEDINKL